MKRNQEQVLVVDDDPAVCDLLTENLKAEGYQAIGCTSPSDALSISERETYRLAFVDINLPQMSGLDLASKLKERDPLREVVFISGFGSYDNAVRALKIGAYDYLSKPFGSQELRLCLKRFQERQLLKEKIRQAEQRYFHLVQSMPLVVFVLRKDFNLEFINDACHMMLGFIPDEATKTPGWLLGQVHNGERKRVKGLLKAAFDSRKRFFTTETRFIHKDGHLIHTILKSVAHAPGNMGDGVDTLEGIIVDITDRVFLEKALVQREKLNTLGAVSAEVSHEIRNPLTAIGGFARRLQKKIPNLSEGEIILHESRRIERVLDRIKNYLKPVEISPQECSVNEIITQCVDLLSPEMDSSQIVCRLDLKKMSSTITVDPGIITEVFINLMRNAVEAMGKGGDLIIKTFDSDQYVYATFRNKAGMEKIEDPESFLLPFDERNRSVRLPLCYKLLKQMGGALCFEQEESDMIFTVSLPKNNESSL